MLRWKPVRETPYPPIQRIYGLVLFCTFPGECGFNFGYLVGVTAVRWPFNRHHSDYPRASPRACNHHAHPYLLWDIVIPLNKDKAGAIYDAALRSLGEAAPAMHVRAMNLPARCVLPYCFFKGVVLPSDVDSSLFLCQPCCFFPETIKFYFNCCLRTTPLQLPLSSHLC